MENEFMIEVLKNQLTLLESDLNLRRTVLSQSGVEIIRNIAYDNYGNGKEVRRLAKDLYNYNTGAIESRIKHTKDLITKLAKG